MPTPNAGESQNDFMGRCVPYVHDEHSDWDNDHVVAACEGIWREHRGGKTVVIDTTVSTNLPSIMARLERVKNLLIGKFGEIGRAFYEATLVRLGVYDPKSQKFNSGLLLKSELKLPFVKEDNDTSFAIGNMCLGMGDFAKIDELEHTVSGYANTCVADCVGDVVFPEAYKPSVLKYDKPIFFMHHTDIPAGKLVESKIDEIGWYAKTQPDDAFWPMILNRTLKGYSIGGWFRGVGQQHGSAIVWTYDVEVDDLSYVNKPCNKLAFFDYVKSESSIMTEGNDVNVATRKNKTGDKKNMPEENKSNSADPQSATETLPVKKTLTDEIQELILSEREDAQKDLLDHLKTKRATDLKAKEDSRLDKLEKMFGEFITKFNEFEGKMAGLTGRLTKMETEPERTAVANNVVANPADEMSVIADQRDLSAMFGEADRLAKTKEVRP